VNPEQKQDDARESNDTRPNAAYKLSGEGNPPDNSELVFYYNREKRLEKAPQPVRDLYFSSQFWFYLFRWYSLH